MKEEGIVRMSAGESSTKIARDLGVTVSTVCLWFREAKAGDRDPLDSLDMCAPKVGSCTVDEPLTYITCDKCLWEGVVEPIGRVPTMRCPGCGRLMRPKKKSLKDLLQ